MIMPLRHALFWTALAYAVFFAAVALAQYITGDLI